MNQTEFLLDMLAYYTADPVNRRSKKSNGKCSYAPITTLSEGCAIGRHLLGTIEEKEAWDNHTHSTIDNIISDLKEITYLKDLRPDWMKDLPIPFLSACQTLHDQKVYWIHTGLSSYGKEKLGKMLSIFELNVNLFSEYLTHTD